MIGVIPKSLMEKELGHGGVTQLHVVGSMHERKQLMVDLSDGFIALLFLTTGWVAWEAVRRLTGSDSHPVEVTWWAVAIIAGSAATLAGAAWSIYTNRPAKVQKV